MYTYSWFWNTPLLLVDFTQSPIIVRFLGFYMSQRVVLKFMRIKELWLVISEFCTVSKRFFSSQNTNVFHNMRAGKWSLILFFQIKQKSPYPFFQFPCHILFYLKYRKGLYYAFFLINTFRGNIDKKYYDLCFPVCSLIKTLPAYQTSIVFRSPDLSFISTPTPTMRFAR